ncbi:MAG TPA: hypothetical protein VF584_19095 [Longimicrobium sp.]
MNPEPLRAPALSNRLGTSRTRDEGGFIILGAIVLVLVLLVVGVSLGKVLRVQYPDSYVEQRAERQWVVADTDLQLGGRPVARLRRGEPVWATRLENGDIAISSDARGQKVVGFVGAYALSNVAPGR